MSKSFKDDFYELLGKFRQNEKFGYLRASDGEYFILAGIDLRLDGTGTYVANKFVHPAYPENDHKEYVSEKHQFLKDKLTEAFTSKEPNLYIGQSCPCCIGFSIYKWMKTLRNDNSVQTTFANLFVNSNYDRFIKEFLPEIQKRKIVIICNENADLSNSKLDIIKQFSVGKNAMINNFNIHEDISKWIIENDIKDHVFLLMCSTLSKVTIYELWKKHKDNFYLDLGSCLDPILGLGCNRDYLRSYWHPELYGRHPDSDKVCVLL